MRTLFVLFLVVPLIEITVLIKVGSLIGVFPTVLAVVGTAVIGVALLKQQGYRVLFHARSKLAGGELPAFEVLEGLMLAIGGALLLTPGFVTDAIGFSLLIPALRKMWITMLPSRFISGSGQHFNVRSGNSAPPSEHPTDNGRTIEGEFRRDD